MAGAEYGADILTLAPHLLFDVTIFDDILIPFINKNVSSTGLLSAISLVPFCSIS